MGMGGSARGQTDLTALDGKLGVVRLKFRFNICHLNNSRQRWWPPPSASWYAKYTFSKRNSTL